MHKPGGKPCSRLTLKGYHCVVIWCLIHDFNQCCTVLYVWTCHKASMRVYVHTCIMLDCLKHGIAIHLPVYMWCGLHVCKSHTCTSDRRYRHAVTVTLGNGNSETWTQRDMKRTVTWVRILLPSDYEALKSRPLKRLIFGDKFCSFFPKNLVSSCAYAQVQDCCHLCCKTRRGTYCYICLTESYHVQETVSWHHKNRKARINS